MAKDLKQMLRNKLDQIAPEYGLVELSYPSFTRCYGYRSQPLSACDAVEGVSALLDVASGVRMEVEIEGARNGGEWFGAGRVWELNGYEGKRDREDEGEMAKILAGISKAAAGGKQGDDEEGEWWIKNFWTAYDALGRCASSLTSLIV